MSEKYKTVAYLSHLSNQSDKKLVVCEVVTSQSSVFFKKNKLYVVEKVETCFV